MIRITVDVDCETWQAQGVKEDLAMYCERYGNTRVVSIDTGEGRHEQMRMDLGEAYK